MIIIRKEIKPLEICTDITNEIQEEINKLNISNAVAIIYSKHTTANIGILENEKLLRLDEKDFLERLSSSNCLYRHDDIEHRDVPPDERRNGYSHLRAMLMSHQQIIPIINNKLDLGKWQRIFFIENDLGKENRSYNICIGAALC